MFGKRSPTDSEWFIPGYGWITITDPVDISLMGQYHNAVDHVLGRAEGPSKSGKRWVYGKDPETAWTYKNGEPRSIYDFEGQTVTGRSREKASIGELDKMGPRSLVTYARQTDLWGFKEYFSGLAEQDDKPRLARDISNMTDDQLYNYAQKVDPEELRRYLMKYKPDTAMQYPLETNPGKIKRLYETGQFRGRPVKYKGGKRGRR